MKFAAIPAILAFAAVATCAPAFAKSPAPDQAATAHQDTKFLEKANQGSVDEIASSLRELVAMGVNHLQVRFMARSVEEYCQQTAAFGAEIGPLLTG